MLLPLRFNDGRLVPDALVAATLRDLRNRFGAVSLETQIIRGSWSYAGRLYHDESMRVFVDIEDSPDSRRWFHQFKTRLKRRFKQIDVWIATYPVSLL